MVFIHCSLYAAFVKVIHVSIHRMSFMIHYQCSEMLVSSVSHSCWHLCNSAHSAEQYITCWIHPFLHLFLFSFQFSLCIKNLYMLHIILQFWLPILCPSTFNRIRPLPTAAHATNYINVTLCKRKHAVRLCCIWPITLLSYSALLQTCQASWDIHLIYSADGLSMWLYNYLEDWYSCAKESKCEMLYTEH